MKFVLTSTLLLFFTVLASCQESINGRVVKIADGDTFTILTDQKKQVKVRLHGVDTPEKSQDFGTKARQFTSDLIFGKSIKVEKKNYDRYGRLIGIAMLPNGKSLNEELLKAGLAWHYKQYDKSRRYAELEQWARSQKKGLWSAKQPVAPWEFRKKKLDNARKRKISQKNNLP
ncbi:thermonuclease family protein [Pedobacter sp. SYSU D00535]|uniref:thermonuclease family protein n=1 Tax=Pedobacter sp. SYSU D00535 TaxID=2810308 RepID=UPI001A95B7A6|nr:thermonuclease family protein [Pedobacter sp. SYSU D00535]